MMYDSYAGSGPFAAIPADIKSSKGLHIEIKSSDKALKAGSLLKSSGMNKIITTVEESAAPKT